jgi:hypothetical protein
VSCALPLSPPNPSMPLCFALRVMIDACLAGPLCALVAIVVPCSSGHDHCQEYAEYKGVSYILSGVGHGCCYSWSNEVRARRTA